MKRLALLLVIPLGLLAAGCTGTGYVETRGTARYSSQPSLVYIEPGVYVLEDYHQPVFYTDGYYWLYDDGYWYSSTYYTGGWNRVRVSYVPYSVRQIDRPRRYVRYHAPADRRRYHRPPAQRDVRTNERVPANRGHRRAAPPRQRDHRATPPRGRDHRATPPRGRDHRRATPPRTTPRGRDHRATPPRGRTNDARPPRANPRDRHHGDDDDRSRTRPTRDRDDNRPTMRGPRGRQPGQAPPPARRDRDHRD